MSRLPPISPSDGMNHKILDLRALKMLKQHHLVVAHILRRYSHWLRHHLHHHFQLPIGLILHQLKQKINEISVNIPYFFNVFDGFFFLLQFSITITQFRTKTNLMYLFSTYHHQRILIHHLRRHHRPVHDRHSCLLVQKTATTVVYSLSFWQIKMKITTVRMKCV